VQGRCATSAREALPRLVNINPLMGLEYVMVQVKIIVRKNNAYRIEALEGSVELVDSDGNRYDLAGKPTFSLCRCGGSGIKPFCDGTHNRIGFQAAESAIKKE
jgi:CDGSH-type Zn-finger protein